MTTQDNKRLEAIDKLKLMVEKIDYRKDPFLYYLPIIMSKPQLSQINPEHAVIFTELALKHDKLPIVKDALLILNRIINPRDGSLKNPGRDIFYENRSFFWNELGNFTRATDIISHIFNKVIFFVSVGK